VATDFTHILSPNLNNHNFAKLKKKRSTTLVQFKGFNFNAQRDHLFEVAHSPYWKLGSDKNVSARDAIEHLKVKGYKCRKNAGKRFAMDALGRYERGLLSYEKFSMDELQAFCKARGLSSKVTTASRLARVLERADDAATFPRFFELAPEIRNLIYELHIQSFDHIKGRHSQPPLTLASKQLRAETLLLFYERATFVIHVRTSRVFRFPSWPFNINPHFELSHLGWKMEDLMYMPASSFARIKTLTVDWSTQFDRHGCHYDRIKVEIDACFTVRDITSHAAEGKSDCTNPVAKGLFDMVLSSLKQNFGTQGDTWGEQDGSDQALKMSMHGTLFNDMEVSCAAEGVLCCQNPTLITWTEGPRMR
jgi:hypothetical protein